ncbi:DUF2797 domain-containing protein [Haloarchaeobius sp. DYHT-AS-18]|uniref:DUF2797 domain-containing protein n=1 Tax=Haloarchaeobius sp. DYHT-AS-18 TaxID=3446117 RepID=UPI003EBD436F
MQIVGYETERESRAPALVFAEDGTTTRQRLDPGTEFAYTLGDRWCAGALSDEEHRPCDRDETPYCYQHQRTWQCAICTGDCDKPLDSCEEEHAVYLAAFAPDTFKVGVTRSWRLETRLREQGADRAAHIHTVSDGRIARQLEAEHAREVPLPDRVRVPTKLAGFGTTVDEPAWTDLLTRFDPIETFAFDYGLDLSVRPVAETVLAGAVVGVKGRVLVLDNAGTTYAVDLRDLVGYGVEERAPERDLQSSLAVFS